MVKNMDRIYFCEMWTFLLICLAVLPFLQGLPDLEFTVEPQDSVVVPGGSALLHCAAQGSAAQRPHIKWRMADRQLLTFIGDVHRSQLVNGSLLFSGVHLDQGLEGSYQCVATLDNVGSIVSRTARLSITTLPHFSKQPADLRVFPGQKAHFACSIATSAPVRTLWLKDERPLRLDETRMILLPSGSLEIDEVQGSDKGSYRCNVTSLGQHRLSSQAVLTINNDLEEASNIMAPVFIAEPHSAIVSEGGKVTLDCAANGYPNPWVTWLKDGAAIDMADLDSRFIKVGSGSLQITSVQESDQGTYQCRANNREDSVDATATLTVQVPPRFIKQPSGRASSEKEDIEFECEIYGKPEPTVEWMKNGDVITQNEYLQVVNGNNLRILGLMELDAGMFQCTGANPAGNIQAAARLTILQPGSPHPNRSESTVGATLGAYTARPETSVSSPTIAGGAAETGATEVPTAPQGLSAVIVSPRFVILSWGKPAATHGEVLTYSVYYRQEGSQRERVYNTTGSRLEEANIAGLTPDRIYYFRVLAYNARGPGDSSEMIEVNTKPDVHVPGPPIGLKATPTGATSILVQWQPPELSNGPVQRYRMFYMGDSSEEHHVDTSELSFELTELNKYTEYNIWAVAYNQNGPGSNADEIVCRTWSDVPSEPPQNVTLEAGSSSSVIVRWEPPPREGQNGIITGYKLRYRKRDRQARGDTVTTAGTRRLYALTGLDKQSVYQVRLWALTMNGTGPPTKWLTIETYENDLDESQVPGTPISLQVRPMTDTITVSWSPPRDQKIMVRGYTIGWGKSVPDVYTQVLDGRQRFFVLESLDPNSEYVISLRAYNEMGDGRPTYETVRTREESAPEPITPLIPPVGLMAAVLSSSTVVVYWTDTTLSKSQRVTDTRHYQVRYTSSHHSSSPRYKFFNATDLNCMIDDLRPNTQYEFTVKVVKGRRESPWSMVVLNMTQEAAPSSQPRDLTVVPIEDNPTSVNMNWQPPKQPNGPITGYVIFYTTDGSQRDRDWEVEGVIGDRMTATIKGLKPDTGYHFKIQARNKKGYGPYSAIVQFTTGPSNGLAFFNRGQPVKDGRGLSSMVYIVAGCLLVLLLAALVVGGVVVCCRRKSAEHTKKGYSKSNMKGKPGKTSIKQPPDLWIHHDQMELKALEKTHSSGGGGGEPGASGMPPQVNTLPRAHDSDDKFHTNSLDKRTYVSSYIGIPTDDKSSSTLRRAIKPKPITIPPLDSQSNRDSISTASPMSSQGQPSSAEVGGRPMYPRTQYTISRAHVTLDQSAQVCENPYSLQGGYDTVVALPPAGGTPMHPSQTPYSTGMSGSGMMVTDGAGGTGTMGKRLQGHPLKSFTVPAPPPQSAPSTPQQKHIVRPQGSSSPYKKAGILAAGGPQGTPVASKNRASNQGPSTAEENARLHPSYSTEELNQEMANLEGLMKDLNAITASEFEC